MSFFKDVFEKLDEIGQEVGRHAGYAVADIGRAVDFAGQEIGKQIDPSTLKAISSFGVWAGQSVGGTAEGIWQGLLGAGEEIGKHTQPFIQELAKSLEDGGHTVRDHLLKAIADPSTINWVSLPREIRDWMESHPERVIGIIISILAGPLAAAAVPAILQAFGFGAGGVAAGVCLSASDVKSTLTSAGSIAAGIQAGIGDVAAGSLFATLASAGAEGAGLVIVQSIAGTLAGMAGIAGIAVPALVVGAAEDTERDEEKSEL